MDDGNTIRCTVTCEVEHQFSQQLEPPLHYLANESLLEYPASVSVSVDVRDVCEVEGSGDHDSAE